MVKVLKTFFAVFLFVFVAGWVVVIFLVKFRNTSYEGQKIKRVIVNYPLLVTLINLNEPGDARFSYKSAGDPLKINLFYSADTEPDPAIELWLADMVMTTLGKKVAISTNGRLDYPAQAVYGDGDLNLIRGSFTHRFNTAAVVNIVYLSSHAEKSNHAGIVLHRDTLFIFKSTLSGLTTDVKVLENLEKSTLMHEWGHLLGLDHIDSDDCIMSEKVEVYDTYFQRQQMPTEYCYEEMTKLENSRKSAK